MNKQGIRDQVIALLNRNDITNAIADTFIDQAVARIQRTLRIPPMEKSLVYTTTAENPSTLILPNDFLELKHLYIDTTVAKYVLQYKDLDGFLRYPELSGSAPQYYTRIQGGFKIKPTPPTDSVVYMVYYGEIDDLIEDTDTNFLSEIAPDLLVYGALTYAADFYVDERKVAFEEVFGRIYSEIVEQNLQMEMSQQGIAVAPAYTFPEY
jgi:hypothetical protein